MTDRTRSNQPKEKKVRDVLNEATAYPNGGSAGRTESGSENIVRTPLLLPEPSLGFSLTLPTALGSKTCPGGLTLTGKVKGIFPRLQIAQMGPHAHA